MAYDAAGNLIIQFVSFLVGVIGPDTRRLSHLWGHTISSSIVVRIGPTLLVLTFLVMAGAVLNAVNGSLPESVPSNTMCGVET